jgi:hypothetical protein
MAVPKKEKSNRTVSSMILFLMIELLSAAARQDEPGGLKNDFGVVGYAVHSPPYYFRAMLK